jgi:hypothetical protein
MKATFPNARIPLYCDLLITTDQLDAPVTTKLLIPCMLAIFAFIFGFGFSQMLSVGIIA